MQPTARRLAAPLITAAVAAAVAIALAIVYFVVVRPDHDNGSSTGGTGALTTEERTIMNAATTEAANLQSFRRAHFAADWARAMDGATGALKSDLSKEKAATLSTLTKGKFDLAADVTHTAYQGSVGDGKSYNVLVTMNGYQLAGTTKGLPIPQRLQVTMIQVGGKWLASDVSQRGLS